MSADPHAVIVQGVTGGGGNPVVVSLSGGGGGGSTGDVNIVAVGGSAVTRGQGTDSTSFPVVLPADQVVALGQALAAASMPVVLPALQQAALQPLVDLVSTANSSTAALAGNAAFTGTAEDVTLYSSVIVTVIADQASAASGLSLQFSSNGTNWDLTFSYTISASSAKSILVPRYTKYFRLVYTNGSTIQGSFRLQTVFSIQPMAPQIVVDTELPAALPLADGMANPTTPIVGCFPAVYAGSTWNRVRQIAAAQDSTGTGIPAAGLMAQLDDSSTATVTENQFAPVRLSSRRALLIEGVASGTAVTVTLGSGSNVVGHVITDSGSVISTVSALTSLDLAQASTTSGQTGPLVQGATTTSAPTYTTAKTNPLSLDTAGNLRVAANLTAGDVAHDGVDSGNPVKVGGKATTTQAAAVSADGDRVNWAMDTSGRGLVIGAPRAMKGNQKTTITSSTAETTIITADASYKLDLYLLTIANTSATACNVTIKDGTSGTTRFILAVPAGTTAGFALPLDAGHVQSAANANWTATCSASVASIEITACYVKNL